MAGRRVSIDCVDFFDSVGPVSVSAVHGDETIVIELGGTWVELPVLDAERLFVMLSHGLTAAYAGRADAGERGNRLVDAYGRVWRLMRRAGKRGA